MESVLQHLQAKAPVIFMNLGLTRGLTVLNVWIESIYADC